MKLDGYPRTCHVCGRKVVLSGPLALAFHVDDLGDREQTSFHFDCWLGNGTVNA